MAENFGNLSRFGYDENGFNIFAYTPRKYSI